MILFKHAHIAAMMTILMAAVCNCQKPDNGQDGTGDDSKNNYFVYDGYSFDINSVVKFEQGDNTVEFWLSPDAGAKTIAEIEAAGDYVVLCTNKAYLGKRDRFSEGNSKYSYISFGKDNKFAYGNTGTAYIEADIQGNKVTIDFLAQKLYTKSDSEIKAALHGKYKGSFIAETEQPYSNEWGIDKTREAITGATYVTYEAGGNSEIILHSETFKEAVKLSLDPSIVGKGIQLPYKNSSNIKITYNGAVDLNISNATGLFSTSVNNGEMTVNMDISSDGKRIRAMYKGEYEDAPVKLNRYIFNYAGTSLVGSGTYEIVKLMVDNNGSRCKFYISPSEGYSMSGSNSTHMPILTVPSSIINAGRKTFMELQDWTFEFVEMQVWPYQDEYRPHPSYADWIEVNQNSNMYEVEFVLSGVATGMPGSSIDVYYKGQDSK